MNKFLVGWCVVYTKPRHEKRVAEELAEAKIGFCLPTKKELRTWHDRRKYIDVPLFRSYVFVNLKDLSDYYNVQTIQGVSHYVRFGKQIAMISERVIEDIRLLVSFGEDIEVSCDYFQPGQKLFIRHGPLTGVSCEVVNSGNKTENSRADTSFAEKSTGFTPFGIFYCYFGLSREFVPGP